MINAGVWAGRACLTHVQVLAEIRLADLTGARLRTLGADARLTTGNYEVTHVWGLPFWEHPDQVDGLVWHSRFDDERLAIGLFDRASGKVGWACQGSLHCRGSVASSPTSSTPTASVSNAPMEDG
jgi:hypothetical protein